MDEAQREARNADVGRYVAVIKRRMRGVDEAYAVMPLWLWAAIALQLDVTT